MVGRGMGASIDAALALESTCTGTCIPVLLHTCTVGTLLLTLRGLLVIYRLYYHM